MTTKDTTIGMLHVSYSDTRLATVEDVMGELQYGYHTAQQYCDFRCSTNLVRFKFDPYTGEMVDWKKVKELLTQNTELICTRRKNCLRK